MVDCNSIVLSFEQNRSHLSERMNDPKVAGRFVKIIAFS